MVAKRHDCYNMMKRSLAFINIFRAVAIASDDVTIILNMAKSG